MINVDGKFDKILQDKGVPNPQDVSIQAVDAMRPAAKEGMHYRGADALLSQEINAISTPQIQKALSR
ncbi:MAG: hypothetical protein IRD7MM_01400 [Candidatus Midichloria mitochondrii]|uniref:hypothetical protein n=1 Tax=Candidatus Midichloria mitochondrii TaxID=234827 RepID=UPI0002D8896A|nr:hypothetical protein [Candidatus Midichloria mitochondrii]MDJ1256981.1 hypothetical protein [Candidatus Midichloria mitochondrii]MDJ1288731.1 hypothetical protein [Candidatus Midichloria mitochondrii]MDJ1299551.1 hypothetical protein [Candidatus Midichloria mitochondrii]MDJ1313644.1 hypothetical protein [Candidatus Midichloria mitochondrii]MDJ1584222.1 hypothetical protein [Candidatus Midichloria mitochondrii]